MSSRDNIVCCLFCWTSSMLNTSFLTGSHCFYCNFTHSTWVTIQRKFTNERILSPIWFIQSWVSFSKIFVCYKIQPLAFICTSKIKRMITLDPRAHPTCYQSSILLKYIFIGCTLQYSDNYTQRTRDWKKAHSISITVKTWGLFLIFGKWDCASYITKNWSTPNAQWRVRSLWQKFCFVQ